MPALLTSAAIIKCPHGGTVTLIPKQLQVMGVDGPIMRVIDIIGAPIVGCLQISPTTKPCTTVVSVLPGSFAPNVLVAGAPALLSTMTGLTDGAPPGIVAVVTPGQTVVQAS